MQTADFDYFLPPELIAQTPARERDQSRLLVLNRSSGNLTHEKFRDLLNYLKTGDVLVLNNSAVIPARLRGVNTHTGGRFEILLLEEVAVNDWWVMLRPGKRARVGTEITIQNHDGETVAERTVVTAINNEGHRRLRFSATANIREQLDALGETPLPPYITRENTNDLAADKSRYQTVYAQPP